MMMRSCSKTFRKWLAPIKQRVLSGQRWDDAEVRAYLARPRPSPGANFVGLVAVLSMGTAAVNLSWFLLSQIKGA